MGDVKDDAIVKAVEVGWNFGQVVGSGCGNALAGVDASLIYSFTPLG